MRIPTALVGVGVFAAAVAVEAATVPVGVEFQVNRYTAYEQNYPALAIENDGDFMVVWAGRDQDGYSFGVFGQRFDSTGARRGVEFQVNTYTSGDQKYAAVAADADGDFVVVWASDQQDHSGFGVFARRFSSNGTALATEFQVNTRTTNNQFQPVVAMDAAGDFVVVWDSVLQDGESDGIFARRFDASGAALATELQVNGYTQGTQGRPTVGRNATGGFVVAWQGPQDGDSLGIFARRFDSAGLPLAVEFQVNSYTTNDQGNPTAAMKADGDFAVAWNSAGQDGSMNGVFARRWSSAGVAQASEFQVNTYTPGRQDYPAVGIAGNGFVVAWRTDPYSTHIGARRFDSSGVALAAEFQANTNTSDERLSPAVGVSSDRFVIVWSAFGQDGDKEGIFGQRYSTVGGLDVDSNGTLGALTDGLLVLRFLFGFTGTTLTGGAIGAGCTRCDDTSITAYLTGLGSALDVDGNGSKSALTDGLLVLRFLFGFSGTTLTGGAVDLGGCSRCDAAAIQTFLENLN